MINLYCSAVCLYYFYKDEISDIVMNKINLPNDSTFTSLRRNRMSLAQQISLPHSNKSTAYIVYKVYKESE